MAKNELSKFFWKQEPIGVLSGEDLSTWTSSLESKYQCQFFHFREFADFYTWLSVSRPNLVVIEYKKLPLLDTENLSRLFKTLESTGTRILIMCDHLSQIQSLRGRKNIHFICEPMSVEDFQDRLVRVLVERYLSSQPRLLVMTENELFFANIKNHFSQFGFEVEATEKPSAAGLRSKIVCIEPQAVLCDVAMQHLLPKSMRENPDTVISRSPFFWIADSHSKNHGVVGTVYEPEKMEELAHKCLAHLGGIHSIYFDIVRDRHTGLALKPLFAQVVLDQMKLAEKRSDEMSLLYFCLKDLQDHDSFYGSIFSTHLIGNLAVFIRNRIRATDFLGLGDPGEVWVMLPRCGLEVADTVCQRIGDQFRDKATFSTENYLFKPDLVYRSYTFPRDFHSQHEVMSLLGLSAELPESFLHATLTR